MTGGAGICAFASLKYTAAFYIGNERSIISCQKDEQVYLLSGTPNSAAVTIIANTEQIVNGPTKMSGGAVGLWNYKDNGDICKSPRCTTNAPTYDPTTTPSAQPSITPTAT
eukprot:404473_1